MGIFIKNVETVRKARAIAARRGAGLTATIDEALDLLAAQDLAKPKRRPTLEEMLEATKRLHAASGGLKPGLPPVTKKDWDDLNAIGYPEIDDA